MSSFDEIQNMQGLVGILSPLLKDYLGMLKNPDGSTSGQPAIYLSSNIVPESTLPRVVLSYQGSTQGFCTSVTTREITNPNYDSTDEDSQETLCYIDRSFHTEYLVNFAVDSGDVTEVLQGKRKSAAWIARYIRNLLERESVRKDIHANIESGVNYIASETALVSLSGVDRVDGSNLLINFTCSDTISEQVDGFIENIKVFKSVYKEGTFKLTPEGQDELLLYNNTYDTLSESYQGNVIDVSDFVS